MNSQTVDARAIWAVLAMEASLALPIISLPTQGDRLPGVLGPLLLLLLLPLGYVGVAHIAELRDPSWRLLAGISLGLLTRAIVSDVPAPGVPGLAIWLAHGVIPTAIGVGLWWRGGALAVAERTAAEVRSEFGVLAVCLLAALAMIRPFLLPDPLLLGGSVAVFAVGGLLATALSRQDAAEASNLPSNRMLAIGTALVPPVIAVPLVGILRPALLGSVWSVVAHIVEFVFTPLGLLLAWLASLIPAGPSGVPALPARPTPQAVPDPAALAAAQDKLSWIPMLIVVTLLVAAGVLAIIMARILLADWINPPPKPTVERRPDLTVERTGTPRGDAQDVWGWLMRWLAARLRRGRARPGRLAEGPTENPDADAWATYQRLLVWAEQRGLGRRPSETTGQLQARLTERAPDSLEVVDLVTSTYERERYGAARTPAAVLRRQQSALRALIAADHPAREP